MERFWEKVSPEPNSGCWLWTAHTIGGYAPPRARADERWPLRLCIPCWLASSLAFWVGMAVLLFLPSIIWE